MSVLALKLRDPVATGPRGTAILRGSFILGTRRANGGYYTLSCLDETPNCSFTLQSVSEHRYLNTAAAPWAEGTLERRWVGSPPCVFNLRSRVSIIPLVANDQEAMRVLLTVADNRRSAIA